MFESNREQRFLLLSFYFARIEFLLLSISICIIVDIQNDGQNRQVHPPPTVEPNPTQPLIAPGLIFVVTYFSARSINISYNLASCFNRPMMTMN